MAELTVEQQLREILADILSQSEAGPVKSLAELQVDRKLSDLGINSVDLMEFVLRAEQQFDVDLLGNLTPNALPETIDAWAAYIHGQSLDA